MHERNLGTEKERVYRTGRISRLTTRKIKAIGTIWISQRIWMRKGVVGGKVNGDETGRKGVDDVYWKCSFHPYIFKP
jgi:hypothetical protein